MTCKTDSPKLIRVSRVEKRHERSNQMKSNSSLSADFYSTMYGQVPLLQRSWWLHSVRTLWPKSYLTWTAVAPPVRPLPLPHILSGSPAHLHILSHNQRPECVAKGTVVVTWQPTILNARALNAWICLRLSNFYSSQFCQREAWWSWNIVLTGQFSAHVLSRWKHSTSSSAVRKNADWFKWRLYCP